MSKEMPDVMSMLEIRTKLRLTQQEIASYLGVAVASISRWEHRHRQPNGASQALFGLLVRALKKKGAAKLATALRPLASADDMTRTIALVHLGD